MTFEVTKPRESTVTCTVTALSESYAQVGVRTVEVGPSDAATRRVTVTVQTTELAVTGTVESCELVERAGRAVDARPLRGCSRRPAPAPSLLSCSFQRRPGPAP